MLEMNCHIAVSAQKYIAMMSKPDDSIRVVNIRGTEIITRDMTVGQLTTPEKTGGNWEVKQSPKSRLNSSYVQL